MKRAVFVLFLLIPAVVLTAGCGGRNDRVGQPLPPWQEGYLDIHAINTGRGECTLLILPDGTTLAIDAGEFSREPDSYRAVAQKPDTLTRPTHVYAAYMRHFMPHRDSLDYMLVTHFHMDHFGQLEPEYERSAAGDYLLSGVTALYEELPFRELVDRAWPAYDSLACRAMSEASLANYRRFVDHATMHSGLKASALRLGADDQFPLRHAPEQYPDFAITGLCANGCVWDGGQVTNCYEGKVPRENAASCGILVRYGAFDYFTAGDIGDNSRLEYPCAKAVGRSVEAMKSNHHMSRHTMSERMLSVLDPDVIVTQSFYVRAIQPDTAAIRRISEHRGKGAGRMYFTNIDPSLTEADPELYARSAGIGGHVVIRVAPSGREYRVYLLDDTNMEYRIKQVDGPFLCKP